MIDRRASPSISPDPKAFHYDTALINLAAAITDGASEIRSPHPSIAPSLDGETAFEVIYPEKTGRRSFGLSRRSNGRLTCWHLSEGEPTGAQPLRILLRKYGLRDDHPPVTTPDPRVLTVLKTLDATTMTSLRAHPRFGDRCYRTLVRLGPDAPIHRFLAHSPGFGPWLEIDDRSRDGSPGGYLSGLHDAEDPLAWITHRIIEEIRRHWPQIPDNSEGVRHAIHQFQMFPPTPTDEEPEDLWQMAVLASCPGEILPTTLEAHEQCLAFIKACDWMTRPRCQPDPRTMFAGLSSDWDRNLALAQGYRPSYDYRTGVCGLGYYQLDDIAMTILSEADREHQRRSREKSMFMMSAIVGARIRRVVADPITFPELIARYRSWETTEEHDRDERRGAFKRIIGCEFLPADLRDPSATAVLRKLGFDIAALDHVLTSPDEFTQASMQEAVLKPEDRDRSCMNRRWAVGGNVFDEAVIGTLHIRAFMVRSGPFLEVRTITPHSCIRSQISYEPGHIEDFSQTGQSKIGRELHRRFGIGVRLRRGASILPVDFYGSEAAKALRVWVRRRPKTAYDLAFDHSTVGDWYSWVRDGKAVPPEKASQERRMLIPSSSLPLRVCLHRYPKKPKRTWRHPREDTSAEAGPFPPVEPPSPSP